MPADNLDLLGGRTDSVREVSVMVATDGALTSEKIEAIRKAAAAYIRRAGYAQSLVAQKLGSNETYISNFLSGRFDAIPAKTLSALARGTNEWMELDHRRRQRVARGRFRRTRRRRHLAAPAGRLPAQRQVDRRSGRQRVLRH